MAHVTLTLRAYLIARGAMDTDAPLLVIVESVDSAAIEHPDWPLHEERSWDEWEAWNEEGVT